MEKVQRLKSEISPSRSLDRCDRRQDNKNKTHFQPETRVEIAFRIVLDRVVLDRRSSFDAKAIFIACGDCLCVDFPASWRANKNIFTLRTSLTGKGVFVCCHETTYMHACPAAFFESSPITIPSNER